MVTRDTGVITDYLGGSDRGRPEDPAFKDGAPAEHAVGVLYQGPWQNEQDGFQQHVRRSARALAMHCPVHLRSFGAQIMYGQAKSLPDEIKSLLTANVGKYAAIVHQLVPDPASFQHLVSSRWLTPEQLEAVNRCRVFSTVFERDRVSTSFRDVLNRVGQVWVANTKDAKMLARSGVEASRVRVVPIPFFDDDPHLALRGRKRQPGPPRFYHIGKWEPRKAQDKILHAFMLAFKPGDAYLVMKTSLELTTRVEGYPQSAALAIKELLERDDVRSNGWAFENVGAWIQLVTKMISSEALLRLHEFGDVYVTLSRGEGFDMPAFDAKLSGNAMIYTDSGGPTDFASEGDFMLHTSSHLSMPCHPFYNWEPDARYADFDLLEAVNVFYAAKSYLNHRPIGNRLWSFSAYTVGRRMLDHLEELAGGPINGKAT